MDDRLLTTGDVARRAGVSLGRVTYALDRHAVRPDARAGILRLYRADRLPELLGIVARVKPRVAPTKCRRVRLRSEVRSG